MKWIKNIPAVIGLIAMGAGIYAGDGALGILIAWPFIIAHFVIFILSTEKAGGEYPFPYNILNKFYGNTFYRNRLWLLVAIFIVSYPVFILQYLNGEF